MEFHSDGSQKLSSAKRAILARISLVRGEGKDVGVPFLDAYIAPHPDEPVIKDYLTAFSGIRPVDLDRNRSSRYLVPRKVHIIKWHPLFLKGHMSDPSSPNRC